MKLSSYKIVDTEAGGNLYAVVTLDNGGTFGQWLSPGTTAEIDAQVKDAVERQARQAAIPVVASVPVGTVRTMADTVAKPATL